MVEYVKGRLFFYDILYMKYFVVFLVFIIKEN